MSFPFHPVPTSFICRPFIYTFFWSFSLDFSVLLNFEPSKPSDCQERRIRALQHRLAAEARARRRAEQRALALVPEEKGK